jgi:hypothetical protein
MSLFGEIMRLLNPVFFFLGLIGLPWILMECPVTSADVSPLYDHTYKVSLTPTEAKGKVGEPVSIGLSLKPYPAPPGLFYSSVVNVMERPKGPKPEIVSGDHKITVRCLTPGNYRLMVRVNVISKSSCGGVSALTIKEQEVRFAIVGKD